jgi:DNA-binding transcriptional LysR family regulator
VSSAKAPDLRQLQAFVFLAEELNFTAAARRFPMSQQALSRLIAQLEQRLGHRLFDRGARGVKLTPEGGRLLVPARRVLAANSELLALATNRLDGPVNELVVDISSGGIATGAAVRASMRDAHPEVPVRQVEISVTEAVNEMRRGRVDALIGIAPASLLSLGLADPHPRHSRPIGDLARKRRFGGGRDIRIHE